jgi:hypothetical protein
MEEIIKRVILLLLITSTTFAGDLSPRLTRGYSLFKKAIVCKPVISSGYRSPNKNKAVKGAKHSYHLSGEALDVKFPMCLTSMEDLATIAKRFFNGVIIYPNHLHIDIRKTPYYGKGRY